MLPAAAAAQLGADELRVYWHPDNNGDSEKAPRRQRIDRLLRNTLAPLLGLPPAALVFGREAHGRPFLRHVGAPDFNLSDTRGGSLIAVSHAARIGVDLERIDRQLPVLRLARRWFGAEEFEVLQSLPAENARVAFLRLWTAKEASCKSTGTGIFGFLSAWRFEVISAPPLLQSAPADAGSAERWHFLRLAPSAEHTAVLALRDSAARNFSAYQLPDQSTD
jgi:4'-phosphopantetheinyl transferase